MVSLWAFTCYYLFISMDSIPVRFHIYCHIRNIKTSTSKRKCIELLIGVDLGFESDILDFRISRYRGIKTVRVFLYFGSGIFSSGSVILDRVRIFRF